MNRRSMLVGGIALAAVTALAAGLADRPPPPQPGEDAEAAFAALKGLEGTWMMAGEDGQPTDQVASVYHVTAGGSALVETMFPGAEHEMVTVYYLEKGMLKMTHYCMLGNRPVLTSEFPTSTEMAFECAEGECCGPEHHMHAALITIVDDNHVTTRWGDNQTPDALEHAVFNLVRKGEDGEGSRAPAGGR